MTRVTDNLEVWNQESYRNLFERKRRLLGRLEGINSKLLEGPN